MSRVELVFTAWNRLAYTRASFTALARGTDWRKVSKLVVYDDGSEDGTREWLAEAGATVPAPGFQLRDAGWHSTGALMNDIAALCEADAFVKVDNDILMPPGWLGVLLDVARRTPDRELIGMEAGMSGNGTEWPLLRRQDYSTVKGIHIGGIGFMRMSAFKWRRPVPLSLGKNGRSGFTIWQHRYHAKAGWVSPDMPVVQLDRIPNQRLRELAAEYVERDWAREWGPYDESDHANWDWAIPIMEEAGCWSPASSHATS